MKKKQLLSIHIKIILSVPNHHLYRGRGRRVEKEEAISRNREEGKGSKIEEKGGNGNRRIKRL